MERWNAGEGIESQSLIKPNRPDHFAQEAAINYFKAKMTQALEGVELPGNHTDPAKQQLSAWWLVSGAMS